MFISTSISIFASSAQVVLTHGLTTINTARVLRQMHLPLQVEVLEDNPFGHQPKGVYVLACLPKVTGFNKHKHVRAVD